MEPTQFSTGEPLWVFNIHLVVFIAEICDSASISTVFSKVEP